MPKPDRYAASAPDSSTSSRLFFKSNSSANQNWRNSQARTLLRNFTDGHPSERWNSDCFAVGKCERRWTRICGVALRRCGHNVRGSGGGFKLPGIEIAGIGFRTGSFRLKPGALQAGSNWLVLRHIQVSEHLFGHTLEHRRGNFAAFMQANR